MADRSTTEADRAWLARTHGDDAAVDPLLDMAKLSRPEADAFRYIAVALGARFAGDEPSEATGASAPDHGSIVHSTSITDGAIEPPAPIRPAHERLLGAIPIPLLVLRCDRIIFANGAALTTFGYRTLGDLVGAGGLAALFERPQTRSRYGCRAMTMRTAGGEALPARARLAPVPWQDGNALLLVVEPQPAAALGTLGTGLSELAAAVARARRLAADLLGADLRPAATPGEAIDLLDAVPKPLLIIDASGRVLAINRTALRATGTKAAIDPFGGFFKAPFDEDLRAAVDQLLGRATTRVSWHAVARTGDAAFRISLTRIGDSRHFCATLEPAGSR